MAQFKSNMTINVSCVTPFICITFKTTLQHNSQEGHFCHRTILFPVIQRYCSADVRMLIFLSLLPHKNRQRRRQKMLLIHQVANTRAHENIYSPDLFISGTPGHPNTHCTFCGLFLSCRKRYIDCEFDLTNRFHVAVRLFSNRSQMTSKCGKNKKVAHKAIAECVTDVLTTFWHLLWSIILLNRHTATWNLFVLYNNKKRNYMYYRYSFFSLEPFTESRRPLPTWTNTKKSHLMWSIVYTKCSNLIGCYA